MPPVEQMGLCSGIPRVHVPVLLEYHVSILSYCPMTDTWDCPMESHVYQCCLNPRVLPILLSQVEQMGLPSGIPHVPVLLEFHLSILSYCPMYM